MMFILGFLAGGAVVLVAGYFCLARYLAKMFRGWE